jgi:chromosome segregation ATPase
VEGALDIVRTLAARDAALAAADEELAALEHETEAIRQRAADLEAFVGGYPAQQAELRERQAEAQATLERCRADERAAEKALARARVHGSEAERAEAERAAVRARRALAAAERALGRVERLMGELEERRAAAELALPEIEGAASTTAARLSTLPRVAAAAAPKTGLAGIVDWASQARAALLLARSGIEREREAVAREASEMGASLLGDPFFVGGTAALLRRLSGA